MTLALLTLLAALVLGLLAVPFLDRTTVEPLPPSSDPVARELAEERDALLRAVEELRRREDLPEARRCQLRERYERKAARVAQRIDARAEGGVPAPRRARPLAWGWALVLLLGVPSVVTIGGFVVPRVDADGTVTTNRASAIEGGRELQRLQRAARNEPTVASLLALGDAYWNVLNGDLRESSGAGATAAPRYVEETHDVYQRITELASDATSGQLATARRRLGYVALVEGRAEDGMRQLERAVELAPDDAEALYTLGEVRYSVGRIREAAAAWRAYLATPGGSGDEEMATLVAEVERLAPLVDEAEENRSVDALLAVADQLWSMEDRGRAAGFYADIVTELNVEHPRAVQRLGMALFFAGNTEQAVLALERARELVPAEPDTLLFLGNAYRALGDDERAAEAWRAYVDAVGGEANAGRVPSLIAEAEGRVGPSTEPRSDPTVADTELDGATLFAQNCASCHGPSGAGGVGTRLAGNERAARAGLVEDAVRFGRGRMPGFGVVLDDAEIESLVAHVTRLAGP